MHTGRLGHAPSVTLVDTAGGGAKAADAGHERRDITGDRLKLPHPVNPALPPVGQALAKAHGMKYLLAQRTTDYNHASLSQTKNIELVGRRLNGIVVGPGETFSYAKHLGPYTAENGYHWGRAFSGDRIVPSMGGGVCQGASTLYSALLRTGLQIVERHPHSLTVPYLPPGEDATVAYGYLDFKFRNNRDTPVLIAAQTDPSKRYLTVAVWGQTKAPNITVHHEVLAKYPYRVVKRCVAQAHAEERVVVLAPGQPGVKVRSWLETETPAGMQRKSLGTDTYKASPRILDVARGTRGCAS